MLDKEKMFLTIAKEIYTKEYIGVDGFEDKEYEDKLTEVAAKYLMTMFYNHDNIGQVKEELLEIMNMRIPKHPSNILSIILQK